MSDQGRMPMNRRWLLLATVLLLVLAVAFAVAVGRPPSQPDDELTLATLRQVDSFPLYVMRYHGDYGFKESLQQGGGARTPWHYADALPMVQWGCTCFAGLSPRGDMVFGRNFDWTTQAALLLFTDPADGYASVSMVDITYLGIGKSEPDAEQRRRLLLHAPFMPFDGMNEQGLVVGMMAVEGTAPRDPHKTTIDSLEAIRLLLDYARDVEEAVSLLQQYNVDFGNGPPVHYLIADAGRNAAVVEYVNGEMKVIRNAQPWQVATNFVLSEAHPDGAQAPCWRYSTAWRTLEASGGHVDLSAAMALLQRVSQSGDYGTRWSVVYGVTSGDVYIAMGRQYQRVLALQLDLAR